MAFKIPPLDVQSLTKGYFRDIPNFRWADVADKDEIGKRSFGSVMKEENYEENCGGKAIFWRGRLKSEASKKGGEDVAKSTAS